MGKRHEWTQNEIDEICREYLNDIGSVKLGNRFGVGSPLIIDTLKRNNIDIRTSYETCTFHIPETKLEGELLDIINGLLLGDGGIVIRKNRNPKIQLTNRSKEYVEWTAQQLESFGIKCSIKCDNREGQIIRYETNDGIKESKRKNCWVLSTRAIPELNDIIPLWYDGPKKNIVPHSINYSQLTLLHWYIGDGYKSKTRQELSLCTNSFSLECVQFLCDKFKEINITVSPDECGGKQKGQSC